MLMMMRSDDSYSPSTVEGCTAEELLKCITADDYDACIAACSDAVDVGSSCDYIAQARLASSSETSGFKLLLDDKELGSAFTAPKTGDDWKTYKEVEIGHVDITEGKHVLKVLITGSYVNLDKIEFLAAPGCTADIAKGALQPRAKAQNYMVFDLMGVQIGSVKAQSAGEALQQARQNYGKGSNFFVKPVRR